MKYAIIILDEKKSREWRIAARFHTFENAKAYWRILISEGLKAQIQALKIY